MITERCEDGLEPSGISPTLRRLVLAEALRAPADREVEITYHEGSAEATLDYDGMFCELHYIDDMGHYGSYIKGTSPKGR